MSFTKHSNLETPDQGTKNWDTLMNENLELLEFGSTFKATAGITVSRAQVGYIDSNKQWRLAQAGVGATVGRHLGFFTADINFQAEGYGRHSGYHSDINWNFVPGPVYLSDSTAGNVTQTAPDDRVLVGVAIQTNELLIRPWLEQTQTEAHSHTTDYIRLHDSKATTTGGGTFTQDAWQPRDITEDQDTGNNVAFPAAGSTFDLEAGTYDCHIVCPAYKVDKHQARLRNTSDSSTTLEGVNSFTNDGDALMSNSIVEGRFTIATQKTFEIQHRCSLTFSSSGFGVSNDFGDNEIYTVAEFWKVA